MDGLRQQGQKVTTQRDTANIGSTTHQNDARWQRGAPRVYRQAIKEEREKKN